jgi:hypothetical protein
VKLEFLRMILKQKLDKAKSALIRKFMTNYLRLTAAIGNWRGENKGVLKFEGAYLNQGGWVKGFGSGMSC